ncbi:4-(cytidine 5'-diphospho)-2-C-methyl-D-erythritol kinase [Draconibacterium sp. IB214405]|uniref:4-(cytidine 5'-diphospho)-2-C-methyl-D-erythritol kinase n=1 Tax=Draconibacterium sp. IB214405 TaxID=3097352 RepID=UPI002A0E30A5|nr:4-(cytidine 5'-diphospho)-2-C-methyl-D-erythritol kinase [Draconibacterium sp. IB214405]MDX8340857.1 4-(cytidine 5'-diphospho)-2-C-methyl-D-erythritol kinase [Draconibacterium sp. IB214405]
MIIFPNAKINIGLNVVEKRPDGYHNLETIFYPVKLSDALEVIESEETSFSSSGIEIDAAPENNLVYKAYSLLARDFDLSLVKMHLHKVIPFGAGLGGGSADAAFALKMLNGYFELGLTTVQLENYAARIGADCPFFIQNKPTFAHGIGDQFKPVKLDLSAYEIVVVKPPFSVSTPQAYQNIIPAKADFNLLEIENLPIEEWKTVVKNDFEKSVFPQFPEIEKLKNQLYEAGAVYASMSGSGSALFGIFRHLPANLDSSLPKGIFIYR